MKFTILALFGLLTVQAAELSTFDDLVEIKRRKMCSSKESCARLEKKNREEEEKKKKRSSRKHRYVE